MAPSDSKQATAPAADIASAETPVATDAPSEGPRNVAQAPVQLTRARFILIFLSLMLCVFLFAVSCPRLDLAAVFTGISTLARPTHCWYGPFAFYDHI